MPIIQLPGMLSKFLDNKTEISIEGNTVEEILYALSNRNSELKQYLYDNNNSLNLFAKIFVNGTNIQDLNNIKTKVAEDDQVVILFAIAGG